MYTLFNKFKIILKITPVYLLLINTSFGQSPYMINYQAVIRNAENVLVNDRLVSIKLSIIRETDTGNIVFSEIHQTKTNKNGLISIQLGIGNQQTGSLAQIDWSEGPYFLKTETDPEGNDNYTISGISQIVSVPYALYAKTAEKLTTEPLEKDPVFTTSPAVNITQNKITEWDHAFNWGNHKEAGYLKTEIDGSVTNELQDLNSVLQFGNSAGYRLIKNLGNPEEEHDAATKVYVDQLEKQLKNFRDTFFYYIEMMGGFINYYADKTEELEKMLLESGQYKISDIDGNLYRIVKIGEQYWMAENLKTTRFNDGSQIPFVPDDIEWQSLSTGAFCWYNNEMNLYAPIYGALYNLYSVQSEKICPEGWHVSSFDEWAELCDFIGGFAEAGGKLKEISITHWQNPNTGATDSYKFTARPGGFRGNDGRYYEIGDYGYWWGPHYNDNGVYQNFIMGYNSLIVFSYSSDPKNGYSVRCVKD